LYLNLILQPLFQFAQHFYEEREGSASGSVLVTYRSRRPKKHTESLDSDPDADPEAQKHTDSMDPDPEADPEHRF
jgi:hypothetical protein